MIWSLSATLVAGQWQEQTSNVTYDLHDVDVHSEQVAAFAGTTLSATWDGGVHWRELSYANTGPMEPYYNGSYLDAVSMVDPTHIIGVGWNLWDDREVILSTPDSGYSWSISYLGLPSQVLQGVEFTNSSRGFAYGEHGHLLRTLNGGADWEGVLTSATGDLNQHDMFDQDHGMIVGDGNTLRTTDGGLTWSASTSAYNHVSLRMLDPNTAVSSAVDQVQKLHYLITYDMGISWQELTDAQPVGPMVWANSIEDLFCAHKGLLRSSTGGQYWGTQSSMPVTPTSLDFIGAVGYAVGQNGRVFKTTNNGGSSGPFAYMAPLPSPVCADDTITLHNLSDPIFSFTWQIDGVNIGVLYDQPVVFATQGDHEVRLTAHFDGMDRSDSAFAYVFERPTPAPLQGSIPQQLCAGQTLTATILGSESGWFHQMLIDGQPASDTLIGTGGPLMLNGPALFGTVPVTLRKWIPTICGEVSLSVDQNVVVQQGPGVISLSSAYDSVCVGVAAALVVEQSLPNTSYQLYANGSVLGQQLTGTGTDLTMDPVVISGTMTFSVQATDINGCTSQSDTLIVAPIIVQASLSLVDRIYLLGSEVLPVSLAPCDSLRWFTDGWASPQQSSDQAPTFNALMPTMDGSLLLRVYRHGCSATSIVQIKVIDQAPMIGSMCDHWSYADSGWMGSSPLQEIWDIFPLWSTPPGVLDPTDMDLASDGGVFICGYRSNMAAGSLGTWFNKYTERWSSDGALLWHKEQGVLDSVLDFGQDKCFAGSVTCARNGDVLTGGNTWSASLLEDTIVVPYAYYDREVRGVLERRNSDGDLLWFVVIEDANNVAPLRIGDSKELPDGSILFNCNGAEHMQLRQGDGSVIDLNMPGYAPPYLTIRLNANGIYLGHNEASGNFYDLEVGHGQVENHVEEIYYQGPTLSRIPDGGWALLGAARGSVALDMQFTPGDLFIPAPDPNTFVAVLATFDSSLTWTRATPLYHSEGTWSVADLGHDAEGNYYITWLSSTNADHPDTGEPVILSDGTQCAPGSGYVASFTSTGSLRWVKESTFLYPDHLVTDRAGNTIVTGHRAGRYFAAFEDSGPIGYLDSLPRTSPLICYAQDGHLAWIQHFASKGDVYVRKILSDACGRLTMLVHADSAFTFAGQVHTGSAREEIIRFDPGSICDPSPCTQTMFFCGALDQPFCPGEVLGVSWDPPDQTNSVAMNISTDDGVSWTQVAGPVPMSAGQLTWLPPDSIFDGTPLSVLLIASDLSLWDSLTIETMPATMIDLGPDTTMCAGGSLVLAPGPFPPGTTYSWSMGSQASSVTITQEGSYAVSIAGASCPATDSIMVDVEVCTGIDDPPPAMDQVQVFPVPASDKFTIRIPIIGDFNLELYDTQGRLVLNGKTMRASVTELDAESIAPGWYNLVVSSADAVYRKKIEVLR